MNRREALKRIALLSGGALSLSTVSAVMGGCTAGDGAYSPRTLSAEQDELVAVISELIIPETDTPGARAAGVNQFVDKMLTDWNTEEEKTHFLSGLNSVNETSNEMHGGPFLDLTEAQQVEVLERLEEDASNSSPMPDTDMDPFFSMMKEYTLVGYYTSEIGATQELVWNHVAGRWDGCFPYSEVGRAWSS